MGSLAVVGGAGFLIEVSQGGCHFVTNFCSVVKLHPPTGLVPVQKPTISFFHFLHNVPGYFLFQCLVRGQVSVFPRFDHAPKGNVAWMVLARFAPVEKHIVASGALDSGTASFSFFRGPVRILFDSLAAF